MMLDGAALAERMVGEHDDAPDPRAYLLAFYPDATPPPLSMVAQEVRPIEVEVNHGLWIWLCPCKLGSETDLPIGGGVAFVEIPLGWCPRCGNAGVGGRWRPLRFPSERVEIERLLALRPDPTERNWWPGETLADLARDNAEIGVGEA